MKMCEVVFCLEGCIIYYVFFGKGKENVLIWSFQLNGDFIFMGEVIEWKNLLSEVFVEIGVNVKVVECEDCFFLLREV